MAYEDHGRIIGIEDIDENRIEPGDICSVKGKRGYVQVILPKAQSMEGLKGWAADRKIFIDPDSTNHRHCNDKVVAIVVSVVGPFMNRSGGNWTLFQAANIHFPKIEEIDPDRLIKYKPEKRDSQDHRIDGIIVPRKLPSLYTLK